MELVIHWFWVVKLVTVLVTGFVIYKAVMVHNFKSLTWNITTAAVIVLSIVSPIKMAPTTDTVVYTMDAQIKQRHSAMPEKVVDNSFKESIPKGISLEDLK